MIGSAVFSDCGHYRHRLDRTVAEEGPVYAYFGVNASTADAQENDHTVTKWIEFTKRFGGSRFIVGNPFDTVCTDVKRLGVDRPAFSPDNLGYIRDIIAEADILVPCWGSRRKVRGPLQIWFTMLRRKLVASAKPIMVFGFTKDGDPKHPLMLPYTTQLVPWTPKVLIYRKKRGASAR